MRVLTMSKNEDDIDLLHSFGLSLNMSKEVAWKALKSSTEPLELSYVAGRRTEDNWYYYFYKVSDMDFDSVKYSKVWAVRFPNQEILTFQFSNNKLSNLNERVYDGKGELKVY